MNKCKKCGFWDSERNGCTCPHADMWYACPIESELPENKKALEEYAEWAGTTSQAERKESDTDSKTLQKKGRA